MRQQSDAGNSPADSLVDSLVAASGDEHVRGAGRDSATEAQVRRTLTRLGVPDSAIDIDTRERESPGIGISLDGQTLRIRQLAEGFLVQGHAIVHGIVWRDARWQQAMYLLTARAQPRTILYGLWNDVKTNELGVLPLMIVALFFAIAVMVFSWDLMMVRGMGRSITQAVGALRGAAERLRAGDLSHRIPIAGEDDLWQVAAAFNTATAGLARAREAEQEQQRIEDELEVARRIQARLLPAAVPRIAGLEIAGHYDPAREIGGDYYDHIALDAARVLVVIADVSGKSVPAALIMAGFRAALVSQDLATCSPPELATRLNGFLLDSLDPGKFVTAFLAVLDGASGRVVYVNAGHNPPVLLRASGAHEMLSAGGTILGIMPASRYERGETTLEPGDLMALYTDGVTEAANPAAEMWGDARLVDTLRSLATAPCEQLVRSIAHEVRAFEGEHGPTDDVTLIAVRRTTR
jgi:serine phosphatase RsbU (regulator of sigma subunit)